jgi:hypothetical protein
MPIPVLKFTCPRHRFFTLVAIPSEGRCFSAMREMVKAVNVYPRGSRISKAKQNFKKVRQIAPIRFARFRQIAPLRRARR